MVAMTMRTLTFISSSFELGCQQDEGRRAAHSVLAPNLARGLTPVSERKGDYRLSG
jgi:hypothetical protein